MERTVKYARSFRELEVYKQARSLSNKIFRLTKNFPKEERYALTDQIRRSSRSVGAQIAEAWGKTSLNLRMLMLSNTKLNIGLRFLLNVSTLTRQLTKIC